MDEEPCILIDRDSGKIVFINSSSIRFTGFTNEEITDKPVLFLFPELNLDEVTTGDTRVLLVNRMTTAPIQVEAKFNFLDPKIRWLRIKMNDPALQNDEEKAVKPASIERLLEFSSLADSESFLLALKEGAEIIQEVTCAEGTAIYQTDSDYPQFKRVACAGVGAEFPEILPYVDSIRLAEVQIWDPGMRVLTDIHKYARSNGFSYFASAPLSEGNAMMGLITCGGKNEISHDLTEQLLITIANQLRAVQQHYLLVEALQKENRAYTHLVSLLDVAFNNIKEGVVLLSPNLTIQHINPAAEWILGYSSQEVEGQEYENVLIGTDRLSPALEEAAKGMVTHNLGKVTLNRRKGQPFHALIQVVPVMQKEILIGIEILLDDISETENNKDVADHMQHRAFLGDLTAAVVHDIRNPINNISLGTQRLESSLGVDDPNQEIIVRIQNECTRLNHLLETLLAYARYSDLHLEVIEIGPFLQRELDRWHPRFINDHINSHINIENNVDKIKGDPRALSRVFNNLILNAMDAMAISGDSLAINAVLNTTSADLPFVEITVSDNGPGIPEDIIDHIFEPLVSASTKGTGLGLTVSKQIITAHKGSISVKSFPGGTHFIVSLPAFNGDSE
ncbi:MAG: ATP-binding protein [Anaerolineaceae bacterium]